MIVGVRAGIERVVIAYLLARDPAQIQMLDYALSGLIGIDSTIGALEVHHVVDVIEVLERSFRGLLHEMLKVRSRAFDLDRRRAGDMQIDRQRIAALLPQRPADEDFVTEPAMHETFELVHRNAGLRYLDSHRCRVAGTNLLAERQGITVGGIADGRETADEAVGDGLTA